MKSKPPPPSCILVVDDDPSLLKIYLQALLRAGYQVDTAEDGDAGWKMLQTGNYNLLITDNSMPKMSGVELIQTLRSSLMNLPVILASSAKPENTETLYLAAFLEKPFQLDQMLQTVEEALRHHRQDDLAPKLKILARQILIYEAATGTRTAVGGSAIFRVCEKLRCALVQPLGRDGFRQLLARALVLAGAKVTWLLALQVKVDGSLAGLDELEAKYESRAVAEGEVVLMAQMFSLLVTFIGPAMTLSLLRDIWPKMDDINF